ncbi:MAG TPA: hypothetical protein VGK99_19970 [Acidobacteriota bacterium]|jgi:hypothetical protein
MHDLTSFTLRDITEASAMVRKMGRGARSMEEVANRIVAYFHGNLADAGGKKSCALVRFFKTHPYAQLPEELRLFARKLLGRAPPSDDTRCLTLMATAGIHPDWNCRRKSCAHQSIPLSSHEMVSTAPMISSLVRQFGLQLHLLVEPSPAVVANLAQRTFQVFHVPEAQGSPSVPEQDNFVASFGIRSVIGFGGMLPTGNLFAVILFSTTPTSRDTAEMFGSLALSAKVAILPFEQSVFE